MRCRCNTRPACCREHLHTRSAAGLFDVSHMGQIALRPKSGKVEDAALALERLVPQDIVAVAPGRQRYAQFTNEDGGILDDLMVANFGDHLFLVVNAACKAEDEAHLRAHLSRCLRHRFAGRSRADRAAGAEGRIGAGETLCRRAGDAVHGCRPAPASPASTASSRAPAIPARTALRFRFRPNRPRRWRQALLENSDVLPIGLGARDSLRLEAGLCLYGHDIDTTTTPVEGALEWSMQKSRRTGGARAGGFPGADKILAQFEKGAPRRRVGLRPEGRAPVREGALLFADATSSEPIGKVTSGGFGPSLNAPVAMGYLPTSLAATGTQVFAEVRGQRLPLQVAPCPSFPTPTNAEGSRFMTDAVHDQTTNGSASRAMSPPSASPITRSRSSATSCSSNCPRSAAA